MLMKTAKTDFGRCLFSRDFKSLVRFGSVLWHINHWRLLNSRFFSLGEAANLGEGKLWIQYGPPHMAEQKQDDQHEHTFSNYLRIQDVVQKTCQNRWTIGKSGGRGSGISVLPARHDDDDDDETLLKKLTLCHILPDQRGS